VVISNIRIRIHKMQLLLLCICICAFIVVIKCGYYSLSVYAAMTILDYYQNLYVSLNNAVITIYKLK
jgi:hypothetical protein